MSHVEGTYEFMRFYMFKFLHVLHEIRLKKIALFFSFFQDSFMMGIKVKAELWMIACSMRSKNQNEQ